MSWFRNKREKEREIMENCPDFNSFKLLEIKGPINYIQYLNNSINKSIANIRVPLLSYRDVMKIQHLQIYFDGIYYPSSVDFIERKFCEDGSYSYSIDIYILKYIKNIGRINISYRVDKQEEKRKELEDSMQKIFNKLGLTPEEFADIKDYININTY